VTAPTSSQAPGTGPLLRSATSRRRRRPAGRPYIESDEDVVENVLEPSLQYVIEHDIEYAETHIERRVVAGDEHARRLRRAGGVTPAHGRRPWPGAPRG
jgi:hypothetical protein